MLDCDQLDCARRAVPKCMNGFGTTVCNGSHASLGHLGAQPRKMGRIVVNQRDEPLGSPEVPSGAKTRPISSDEHRFNQEIEIKATKTQHQGPSLLSASRWPRSREAVVPKLATGQYGLVAVPGVLVVAKRDIYVFL